MSPPFPSATVTYLSSHLFYSNTSKPATTTCDYRNGLDQGQHQHGNKSSSSYYDNDKSYWDKSKMFMMKKRQQLEQQAPKKSERLVSGNGSCLTCGSKQNQRIHTRSAFPNHLNTVSSVFLLLSVGLFLWIEVTMYKRLNETPSVQSHSFNYFTRIYRKDESVKSSSLDGQIPSGTSSEQHRIATELLEETSSTQSYKGGVFLYDTVVYNYNFNTLGQGHSRNMIEVHDQQYSTMMLNTLMMKKHGLYPLPRYLGYYANIGRKARHFRKDAADEEIDDSVTSSYPDYGGLVMQSLRYQSLYNDDNKIGVDYGGSSSPSIPQRTIRSNDDERYSEERYEQLLWIDDNTYEKNSEEYYVENYYYYDDIDYAESECHRPKWSFTVYPTCNVFHESIQYLSTLDGISPIHVNDSDIESSIQGFANTTVTPFVSFIDNGYFRDSFLFDYGPNADDSNDINIVLKSLRYQHVVDMYNVQKINNEAVVMERLTSSNLIMNLYGHCGTSIAVERGYEIYESIVPHRKYEMGYGRIQRIVLEKLYRDGVFPMNSLSTEEKLDIAITMAESLAEIHGYNGGVITMDDVEVYQWLQTNDIDPSTGKQLIKLNDFGNSKFLEWNPTTKTYCKYWASFYGSFRAPEEYGDGTYVDESADIWPFGNILYTLLTGLMPYYDLRHEEEIQAATKKYPPDIDHRYHDRSYIERRLYTLMKKCHRHDPSKRISIFEIVQYLHETRNAHKHIHDKNEKLQHQKVKAVNAAVE